MTSVSEYDTNAAVNASDPAKYETTIPIEKGEEASHTTRMSGNEAADKTADVIYMSDMSNAKDGGSGNRPSTRDADNAKQAERDGRGRDGENEAIEAHTSEQPEGGDNTTGSDDDALDVLPYDELDEAAVQ